MSGRAAIRRTGFTLLELLVAVAIVGVLTALVLSAVQRARAAAARAACGNNLRQIGLAAHLFHDGHGRFPSGFRSAVPRQPFPYRGWLADLLPYVEQQALADLSERAYWIDRNPFHAPPHAPLGTPIRVFGCPSDARVRDTQVAEFSRYRVGLASYLGVSGSDLASRDGVLYPDSRVRFADVTDGTAGTLLAGERPPSPDFQFGWWYAGAGQALSGSADSILGVREYNTFTIPYPGYSCLRGPYHFVSSNVQSYCAVFHYWSTHPGGANFLFADGAVRFLSYSADSIIPALASRSGGEAVSVPE